MSSGLVNGKTLVPPFNFGRKVSEEDWDKMFPNGPKRTTETEEEYLFRTKGIIKQGTEKGKVFTYDGCTMKVE